MTVRRTIQLALGVMMGREHITARDAYVRLRLHAADTGVSLPAAATSIITTAA
jgi:AmiR/NasT family two-component response regulator